MNTFLSVKLNLTNLITFDWLSLQSNKKVCNWAFMAYKFKDEVISAYQYFLIAHSCWVSTY